MRKNLLHRYVIRSCYANDDDGGGTEIDNCLSHRKTNVAMRVMAILKTFSLVFASLSSALILKVKLKAPVQNPLLFCRKSTPSYSEPHNLLSRQLIQLI